MRAGLITEQQAGGIASFERACDVAAPTPKPSLPSISVSLDGQGGGLVTGMYVGDESLDNWLAKQPAPL